MSSSTIQVPREVSDASPAKEDDAWKVVLFNDQVHTFHEVILLLVLATGFDLKQCLRITEQVHVSGRAEVLRTDEATAEKVAKVLTDGGLLAAIRPA